MNIIEHAEKFLGDISQGWKEKQSSGGLQVVCFNDAPFETINTFLTIGLSYHELNISDDKMVRQELVMPVSNPSQSGVLVSLLLFICEFVLRRHHAIRRGQVIRLGMDVTEAIGFDAVYCTIPVFLDDDFSTFTESNPPTVIVWLIPIYRSEADYIDANGWSKFEDLLEEKDPDLFSLKRDPVI